MALLKRCQIESMGFASCGDDVRVSDRASFYGVDRIHLGSHVRIDDYCVLSAGCGGIRLGSYIHIAIFTSLMGSGAIVLNDFCNLSSRVAIYSSSDDYSGRAMTNPMVPLEYTNVTHAPVVLGKHVIVGCGSVIMPGVTIDDGVAIGALSLVSRNCTSFGIYAGIPAKRIRERSRDLLEFERRFVSSRGPLPALNDNGQHRVTEDNEH